MLKRLHRSGWWAAMIVAVAAWGSACADDAAAPRGVDASVRAAAAEYAFRGPADAVPLMLVPEPVLNWSNPERQQERGAMFVWTRGGRPEVIGSLFTYAYRDRFYEKHEFQSLSDDGVTAVYQQSTVWQTRAPGVKWFTPGDAPSPSRTLRLSQMRTFAREYTVKMTNPDGIESLLRPLAQPLYRYAALQRKVVDGAIFSYVVATDPEALLIVEAVETNGGLQWRAAFARMHYWELSAENSAGTAVWSAELDKRMETNNAGDAGNLDKTYISFHPARSVLVSDDPTPAGSP
jgi:hypothetical protein